MRRGDLPEIPDTQQAAGGHLHRVEVQRHRFRVVGAPKERGRYGSVDDAVPVVSPGGAAPGVELLGYLAGGNNTDVFRQVVVHGRRDHVGPVRGAGDEIDHLPDGMGAGVGATGSPYPGALAGEAVEGFFQFSLDRRDVGLKLKAGVLGAFVGDHQGDAALRCLDGALGCHGVIGAMAIPQSALSYQR